MEINVSQILFDLISTVFQIIPQSHLYRQIDNIDHKASVYSLFPAWATKQQFY